MVVVLCELGVNRVVLFELESTLFALVRDLERMVNPWDPDAGAGNAPGRSGSGNVSGISSMRWYCMARAWMEAARAERVVWRSWERCWEMGWCSGLWLRA